MYFDVTKATYDAGRNVQSMKLERWFQTRGDFVSQGRLVVPRRGGVALLTSAVAAAAKSLQLFLTLCDPIDGSSSGSSVPGILQARILEWVTVSSSRRSFRPRDGTCIPCIGRWILSPLSHLGSPLCYCYLSLIAVKNDTNIEWYTVNHFRSHSPYFFLQMWILFERK